MATTILMAIVSTHLDRGLHSVDEFFSQSAGLDRSLVLRVQGRAPVPRDHQGHFRFLVPAETIQVELQVKNEIVKVICRRYEVKIKSKSEQSKIKNKSIKYTKTESQVEARFQDDFGVKLYKS